MIDFSTESSPLMDASRGKDDDFIHGMMALDYNAPENRPTSSANTMASPRARTYSAASSPPQPATAAPTTAGGRAVAEAAERLGQPGEWNFPHADQVMGHALRMFARDLGMRFDILMQPDAGGPTFTQPVGENPLAPYAGRLVLRQDHYGVEIDGRFHDLPPDGDCAFHAVNVLFLHAAGEGLGRYVADRQPDGTLSLRVPHDDPSVGDAISWLREMAADDVQHHADEIGRAIPDSSPRQGPNSSKQLQDVPTPSGAFSAVIAATQGRVTPGARATTLRPFTHNDLRDAVSVAKAEAKAFTDAPEADKPKYRPNREEMNLIIEIDKDTKVLDWSGRRIKGGATRIVERYGFSSLSDYQAWDKKEERLANESIQSRDVSVAGPSGQCLENLTTPLSQQHRAAIASMGRYLKRKGTSLDELAPAGSGKRPAALERVVNEGGAEGLLHLQRDARRALNQAYDLGLKGEKKRRYALAQPEHIALMNEMSGKLHPTYHSLAKMGLRYLEDRRLAFSQLAPDTIKQIINGAIKNNDLRQQVRPAISELIRLQSTTRTNTAASVAARTLPEFRAKLAIAEALQSLVEERTGLRPNVNDMMNRSDEELRELQIKVRRSMEEGRNPDEISNLFATQRVSVPFHSTGSLGALSQGRQLASDAKTGNGRSEQRK
jgi:hypothetical protein